MKIISRILDLGFWTFGTGFVGILLLYFIIQYKWWTLVMFPLYILITSILAVLIVVFVCLLYLYCQYVIIHKDFSLERYWQYMIDMGRITIEK